MTLQVLNHKVDQKRLVQKKDRTISREEVRREYGEEYVAPVFDHEDFYIYGPASVEQVDKQGQEIRMSAIEDALGRFFSSEKAPGIISYRHKDVPIGIPVQMYSADGHTYESHVTDDTLYLCANLANDTEKAKEARLRSLTGDLDGYSVTVYSKKEAQRTEDGARVTTECDFHAVTLGTDEQIVNPDAEYTVVDSKSLSPLTAKLLKSVDEKINENITIPEELGVEDDGTERKKPDPSLFSTGPQGSEFIDSNIEPSVPGAKETMDMFESEMSSDDMESGLYIAKQFEDGNMTESQAMDKITSIYPEVSELDAGVFLDGLTQKLRIQEDVQKSIKEKVGTGVVEQKLREELTESLESVDEKGVESILSTTTPSKSISDIDAPSSSKVRKTIKSQVGMDNLERLVKKTMVTDTTKDQVVRAIMDETGIQNRVQTAKLFDEVKSNLVSISN